MWATFVARVVGLKQAAFCNTPFASFRRPLVASGWDHVVVPPTAAEDKWLHLVYVSCVDGRNWDALVLDGAGGWAPTPVWTLYRR